MFFSDEMAEARTSEPNEFYAAAAPTIRAMAGIVPQAQR
jgi:hypothetical protein